MRKTDDNKLNPPLKWAGGKRYLVPRLLTLWQGHEDRRLVEPFVGGASVALGLRPERALLNDINPHLINFYRQIKRDGLPVTLPMVYDRDVYDGYRLLFNNNVKHFLTDTPEHAQIFYYLNRTCFNGLCRFNSKGFFNVPFGRYKTVNYAKAFYALCGEFQGWDFTCGDFEAVKIEADDFLYIDSPYDTPFTTYSAGGFSWKDQERLAEWLASQSVPIVASNMATKRIVELYERRGFEIELVSAPRRISCDGNREQASEILATKNLVKHIPIPLTTSVSHTEATATQ
jgi:DNA adenine methylase